MQKKIIFSGIQPSGNLHLGNYLGAIKQWVKLQEDSEAIFCIVDLHAITVYQDPKILREKSLEVAALYIACGIDPERSHIFIQSENPDHSYLSWIFDCVIPFGWMGRMTQFKDKSAKQKESTSIGLFNYPALMAADILLYDTDLVPVGEDQTQHVELTRNVAERFNRLYGNVFKVPNVMLDKQTGRIMSLQNPTSKMSKSANDLLGTINLLDPADEIEKKIKRAVTDSGSEIVFREEKKAMSNLLVIYSKLINRAISEIEEQYKNKTYSEFKNDLSSVVVEALKPIQTRYYDLRKTSEELDSILNQGLDFTLEKSNKKIIQVKKAMGLGRV